MPITHPTRRTALCTAAALAMSSMSPGAGAQERRPLEWVVGMSPGGGTDIVARTVADQMGKTLGQTIVVVNKPGAAHNIAADYVARSSTPGNLLLTGDYAVLATNPWLYSKLSYNVDKDLASVGMLVRFPLILVVSPKLPVRNFQEFVAWAKAQPEGVNFASPGAGTPHHLAMELLKNRAKISLTHISYRGTAPAVTDLLGGQIDAMFLPIHVALQHVKAGKLKALAISSGTPHPLLPEVPSLNSLKLGDLNVDMWYGVFAPAGTPRAYVDRLNTELREVLAAPAVAKSFETQGMTPAHSTPDAFKKLVAADAKRWSDLIKAQGITAE